MPECDNANNPIYDQSWASYAVPGTTDSNGLFIPEQCIRFKRVNSSNFVNDVCTEDSFSHETEICNQWVYDNTERTIVQEVTILQLYEFNEISIILFYGLVDHYMSRE